MQTENFKTSLCSVPVEGTNFEDFEIETSGD